MILHNSAFLGSCAFLDVFANTLFALVYYPSVYAIRAESTQRCSPFETVRQKGQAAGAGGLPTRAVRASRMTVQADLRGRKGEKMCNLLAPQNPRARMRPSKASGHMTFANPLATVLAGCPACKATKLDRDSSYQPVAARGPLISGWTDVRLLMPRS